MTKQYITIDYSIKCPRLGYYTTDGVYIRNTSYCIKNTEDWCLEARTMGTFPCTSFKQYCSGAQYIFGPLCNRERGTLSQKRSQYDYAHEFAHLLNAHDRPATTTAIYRREPASTVSVCHALSTAPLLVRTPLLFFHHDRRNICGHKTGSAFIAPSNELEQLRALDERGERSKRSRRARDVRSLSTSRTR